MASELASAVVSIASSTETLLIVPRQRIPIRPILSPRWRHDLLAMQRIIVAPVFEFLADPFAHLKAQVGRDRDVAGIEQAVDVAPQQQAIARLVAAAVAIGADVGGLQRRECALPMARLDQMRLAMAGLRLARQGERPTAKEGAAADAADGRPG